MSQDSIQYQDNTKKIEDYGNAVKFAETGPETMALGTEGSVINDDKCKVTDSQGSLPGKMETLIAKMKHKRDHQ